MASIERHPKSPGFRRNGETQPENLKIVSITWCGCNFLSEDVIKKVVRTKIPESRSRELRDG